MDIAQMLRDLMKSWKSSINFFLPPALKPFFLVSLKALLQTYRTLFEQLWPLMLLAATAQLAYVWFCIPSKFGCLMMWLLAHTLSMLMVFLIILIIRPSIKAKNLVYYRDYIMHFLLFLLITTVLSFFKWYPFFIAPPFLFYLFFMLDTPFNATSMLTNGWRAIKMCIYGAPFCCVMWFLCAFFLVLCMIILSVPLSMLFRHNDVALQIGLFCFYLLLPFVYVWYANFYVKRVHDQFSLYF